MKVKNFWAEIGCSPVAIADAQGHAGGIWLLSSTTALSTSIIDVTNQCVTVQISLGGNLWYLSAIYASPIPSSRFQL